MSKADPATLPSPSPQYRAWLQRDLGPAGRAWRHTTLRPRKLPVAEPPERSARPVEHRDLPLETISQALSLHLEVEARL